MNQIKSTRFQVILLLICSGIFSRLIPHPPNFTAIIATGLFGGFYLKNIKQSISIIGVAMVLSDAIIGFHPLMWCVYLALYISVFMGQNARTSSPFKWIVGGSLISSTGFFIITNFAVWIFTPLYSKTFSGFLFCYEAAIPFFVNQIIGDLFYSGLIFGVFFILKLGIPVLNIDTNQVALKARF